MSTKTDRKGVVEKLYKTNYNEKFRLIICCLTWDHFFIRRPTPFSLSLKSIHESRNNMFEKWILLLLLTCKNTKF